MTTSDASVDQGLQALIVGFPETEYRHLRGYAEAIGAGDADEASDELQFFIAQASAWEERKQRQAAVRIADAAATFGAGPGSNALPTRLWDDFVEPVLTEWAEEDNVALPHRLLALLDWASYRHLRRAIELDPEDDAMAQRLASTLIRDIDYSAGQLGRIDLSKLEEAEVVVNGLRDAEAKRALAADLDDLRGRLTRAPDSARHPYE